MIIESNIYSSRYSNGSGGDGSGKSSSFVGPPARINELNRREKKKRTGEADIEGCKGMQKKKERFYYIDKE
jgi:hypothetical protein